MVVARAWLLWSEDQILTGHSCPACRSGYPLPGPPAAVQLRRCHNHVVLATTLPQRRSCRRPEIRPPGRLPPEEPHPSYIAYLAGGGATARAYRPGEYHESWRHFCGGRGME